MHPKVMVAACGCVICLAWLSLSGDADCLPLGTTGRKQIFCSLLTNGTECFARMSGG